MLQTAVRLFGAAGSDAIPKLVSGWHWVILRPAGAGDLVAIPHESLGVTAN